MPRIHDAAKPKIIHVKTDVATHRDMRIQMIRYNLTMQEVFEELMKMVANDHPLTRGILERLIRARVKQELDRLGIRAHKPFAKNYTVDLDQDKLYDMITSDEVPGRPKKKQRDKEEDEAA